MTWHDITSSSNPALRRWRRIADFPREARRQQATLAEGIHLAQAALASPLQIAAAIVRAQAQDREIQTLVDGALARGATAYRVGAALYDQICPVEHGVGLMFEVRLPATDRLQPSAHDVVFLDGIQDPGNVGTVLRTAAAAGIRSVFTSADTAAVWAPRTLRAGQGAHFRLSILENVAPDALAQVVVGGWYAADAHDAVPLWDAVFPHDAIGWIFGAEGRGLSSAARALSRQRLTIPLDATAESLNVAAAAAICLFERRRRLASLGTTLAV